MFKHVWKEASSLPRTAKTLRSFGLLVGSVLMGIAAYLAWRAGWHPGTAAMVL
ncbi:MAG: hypothetical protein HKN29_06200, partial [Rhodothermales bacterium]|nr:hypothetical protein [Rhodothermales bacterium]